MKKKNILLIFAVSFIIVGAIFFTYSEYSKDKNSFNVNPVLLKSVIKQGEISSSNFKITNLKEEGNFQIDVIGLDNLTSLRENNFKLSNLDSKEIEIIFNGLDSAMGIYVGSLIVKDSLKEKAVPVILEIQSQEIIFAVNLDVGSKYKEIEKKGNTLTDVKFFNLKDTEMHSLEVEYVIKDINGKILVSETEIMTVGSKSSITKTISLPDNTESGKYVFGVTAKYENSVSTSSYLFDVVDKKKGILSDMNLFSSLVVIFLFVIIILIIYILYERNKLFLALKSQHGSELKFYSDNVEKQKKESLAKARTVKEKKKILNEFNKAKEEIINEIKKEQKKQKTEFKELRKSKDKKAIEQKLQEWKKGVYPKALEAAQIDQELKLKLMALERAYSEGYISKKSYRKGSSRIKSANRKIKGKSL